MPLFSLKSAAIAGLCFLSAFLSASVLSGVPASAEPRENVFVIADGHTADGAMETTGEATDSADETGEAAGEPTAASTIVDIASSSDTFSTLVEAVTAADLAATLSEPGPYTVFAPTDEAFAQLPEGAVDFLLQPENQELLSQVLTYHVVPGAVTSDQLSPGGIDALGGGLAVGLFDSRVVINNASVTQADIQASNGVIHQINRVLVPTTIQQQLATRLGVSSLYQ